MANGVTRLVQSKIINKSQSEINNAFKNENDTAIATKKIPLKNPSEHNHSK